jgi:hypothetical protein
MWNRKLEADHPSPNPHGSSHLPEAILEAGQVAQPEGDRRGIEGSVGDRQRQSIAEYELNSSEITKSSSGLDQHCRRQIHPQHDAIRSNRATQGGREFACATGHVEGAATPGKASRLDGRSSPSAIEAAGHECVDPVIYGSDRIEHPRHAGFRDRIPGAGPVVSVCHEADAATTIAEVTTTNRW